MPKTLVFIGFEPCPLFSKNWAFAQQFLTKTRFFDLNFSENWPSAHFCWAFAHFLPTFLTTTGHEIREKFGLTSHKKLWTNCEQIVNKIFIFSKYPVHNLQNLYLRIDLASLHLPIYTPLSFTNIQLREFEKKREDAMSASTLISTPTHIGPFELICFWRIFYS